MQAKYKPRLLTISLVILTILACQVFSPSGNPTSATNSTPPSLETPSSTAVAQDTATQTSVPPTATPTPPALPKFVYVTHRENSMEIYGSQIDGSQVVLLTLTDRVRNWNPAFSPDCTQLVYQADTTGHMLLYILDLTSDEPPRLLTSPDIFDVAEMPSWSPNGNKIVFSGQLHGESSNTIFTIRTDNSKYARLTGENAPGRDDCPSWSPDGKYIAYLNTPSGATHYLIVMKPDGSESQSLLAIKYPDYGCPSWSPDSSQMAIVIPGEGNHGDIAIINRDGSGFLNLTNSEDQEWEPAWSPAGDTIAFMNAKPGDGFDIFLMNIDGSNKTPLFNSPFNEHQPAYCPIP